MKISSKLYMLVGISGSGKSTIAKDLSQTLSAEIFSSDAIRFELYGDESIQNNPNKIFSILHRRIKEKLKQGGSAIYDATNLSMKRRIAFLKEINNIRCEKICIIVNTPFDECVARNNLRNRVVPYEVLERQRRNFQCPYFCEGWDKILISNCDTGNLSVLEHTLEYLRSVPHDNPHHNFTIGMHMDKANEYCVKKAAKMTVLASNKNLQEEKKDFYLKEAQQWNEIAFAAKYHDLGKSSTKSFTNRNGEITKEAHYYNHHTVSAYIILSNLSYNSKLYGDAELDEEENILFWLKTAVLVQWHMEYYFRKDKAWNKFRELIGEEMIELLDKLHEADKAAH